MCIRDSGYTVYEPMNYTDADGNFTGFDTEMCIRDSNNTDICDRSVYLNIGDVTDPNAVWLFNGKILLYEIGTISIVPLKSSCLLYTSRNLRSHRA